MKKVLALFCMAFATINLQAQDFKLYVQQENSLEGYELSSLQKLVLKDGRFFLTLKDGTIVMNVAKNDVARMFFTKDITNIESATDKTNEKKAIKGTFDLTGRKISSDNAKLRSGIYIVDGKKMFIK